jgi:hypothetical protein
MVDGLEMGKILEKLVSKKAGQRFFTAEAERFLPQRRRDAEIMPSASLHLCGKNHLIFFHWKVEAPDLPSRRGIFCPG